MRELRREKNITFYYAYLTVGIGSRTLAELSFFSLVVETPTIGPDQLSERGSVKERM